METVNGRSRVAGTRENGRLPANTEHYGLAGVAGKQSYIVHRNYPLNYKRVVGPLVARRFCVDDFAPADAVDPFGKPLRVLESGELALSVSKRVSPMPFVYRNADFHELHFLHRGRYRYETDFGSLEVAEGTFVIIPRTIGYRILPEAMDNLLIICETSQPLLVDAPAGPSVFNPLLHMTAPSLDSSRLPAQPEYELRIKANGEMTSYFSDDDPLDTVACLGESPVGAFSYSAVRQPTLEPGGPALQPAKFLGTRDNTICLCVFNSRACVRPPIHRNADYDELVFYHRGPGAYGDVTRPGTFLLWPKGINHHGPEEDVEGGYSAWMIEPTASLKLTPEAVKASVAINPATCGPLV